MNFFALIMVNNVKVTPVHSPICSGHVYCVSDDGRSRQGSSRRTEDEKFSVRVCGPHKLNSGLAKLGTNHKYGKFPIFTKA